MDEEGSILADLAAADWICASGWRLGEVALVGGRISCRLVLHEQPRYVESPIEMAAEPEGVGGAVDLQRISG